MDKQKIRDAVTMILEAIDEDPTREGLRDTPRRVADMYEEIFCGMQIDPGYSLSTIFTEEHEGIILVKDIPMYSMCEHHLLPFFGMAHVAYLPKKGRIVGLSKLARLVEGYARRPQLQERLTAQIADTLVRELDPLGAMVVIEAEHMCMTMRGVKKAGTKTITSAVRGAFRNESTRQEVMALITQ